MAAMTSLSMLLLAGCGNGTSGSTSAQSLRVGTAAPDQVGGKGGAGLSTPSGASSKPAEAAKPGAPPVGIGQKLTKSASIDLRVKNIEAAAARVRAIATGLQAQILSEQLGNGDPGGPPVPLLDGKGQSGAAVGGGETGNGAGFGTMTLSVPADKLDAALAQLASARVGTVLRQNTSSQDVTSQFVDTASRLKTMRASVERVRALMSQAKDLGQVVTLEGELSQREADLESLESQLNALKDSVARSQLAVSLSTPGNEPVVRAGFTGGLRSGWDAFVASASGLLTGIGAALPFILFFALLGVPLWWAWRRRRPAPSAPDA